MGILFPSNRMANESLTDGVANELQANEYQCAMCEGVFAKDWTDEEAKAEYDEYFPNVHDDLTVTVCDDCYNRIHPKDHPMQVALANLSEPPPNDAHSRL